MFDLIDSLLELRSEQKRSFSQKKFLLIMIGLIVTSIVDISIVKINDLIDKFFIPQQGRLILFAVNSTFCLFLQFYLVKYIHTFFQRERLNRKFKVKSIYVATLLSLSISASLIGFLIFQQFYYSFYYTSIVTAVIALSYGIAAGFVIWLALLFFSWYKSHHDKIVLLYSISISVIAFNLIMTATFMGVKMNQAADLVGDYIGSSGDATAGRNQLLNNLYRISSFISFFGIWMTTAILMSSYREKLIGSVKYWVILMLPLAYFLITYFYQFFLSNLLVSYLQNDPITVSIIVSAFLSLSKPIGGLIFAVAFWNMSRVVGYERKMKLSMVIAGWGIFFIFGANQAATQTVLPYPPFGITTVTILNMASFLIVLGIFNSASLVSANNSLRTSLHKHALKLLKPIGRAEMQKEIQKTVKKISEHKEITEISSQESFEFDENELEKYLKQVIKEIKKEPASK